MPHSVYLRLYLIDLILTTDCDQISLKIINFSQVVDYRRLRDSRVSPQHPPGDGALAAGANGALERSPQVQRGAPAPFPDTGPGLGAGTSDKIS